MKRVDRSKTRGGDRGRVKTEMLLCVSVGNACWEGENGGGNRYGDKRRRPSQRGYIAYASVVALRLR